jgi:acyl-CoA synthetase (AMP-forming)/AMP-acid ligase II
MIMGENYERNITLIRSDISRFSRGTGHGIPDPQWGELVMAYIVLKPRNALTVDDLIAHCRRSLANSKIPRRVEFSETELPKSGSGKVLKRILWEHFWAHQERVVG